MALEYLGEAINYGQTVTVLHCGDHDPSGIDMTRDLEKRFTLFLGDDADSFNLQRIALTRAQVDEKKPPPNPAKLTDSRIEGYKREHGNMSWELDALEPAYLVALVKRHITSHIDNEKWEEREEQIEAVRAKLHKVAEDFVE